MACTSSLSALGVALFLASTGEPPERGPLVIGTIADFPPNVVTDETGALTGFEPEILTEACKRLGRECRWELAEFEQLIPGVMEGRFDIVHGGMGITPERRQMVDFISLFSDTGDTDWFVGRPGTAAPEAVVTGVQSGTIQEAWLRDQRLEFRSYPNDAALLAAVAGGEIGLGLGSFGDRPDLEHLIAGQGLDLLYPADIDDEGVGLAVCRGRQDLVAEFQGVLAEMQADGTFGEIEYRWFW